ncbi:uncharacterized protein LOC122500016 [Leptopilina heterotoma]|uniref:uncharacterized protein LOC122500016 n=1 Tax=Leptopilina heterotoma TaxID=63436 RepID=UPI001CA8E722|nr:uncharacterized protein LOC122500016 [Leptopilina heterotoma]
MNQRNEMMLIRIISICFIILAIGLAHGLPLQNLPNIPGYIPVYIRYDEQPLIEINPNLAEAFHEEQNFFQGPSAK